MNHTAVVTGLMRREPVFGLQEHHSRSRPHIQQRVGRGQAHNPSADYYNVVNALAHKESSILQDQTRFAGRCIFRTR
jgi:hypothetical protein